MLLTNRLGLPASIVQAVANDSYRGGGDISVTALLAPPYQRQLLRGLGGKLVEDAADRIWSMLGQIGHSIVERMTIDPATSVAEERLYSHEVPAGDKLYSVSGQFDLIENHRLIDFKFTSVYSADGKLVWEQQLNLLRVLCFEHWQNTNDDRYRIDEMQIICVFRDWMKAKVGMADYPTSQIAVIPIKMWPIQEAKNFMMERLELHMSANPPVCSDEERWATEEVFALMKKGRKTAVKLYKDEQAAQAAAALKGKDHTVVHRPREYKRCQSYCSAAQVCPVWKAELGKAPF